MLTRVARAVARWANVLSFIDAVKAQSWRKIRFSTDFCSGSSGLLTVSFINFC